MLAKKKDLQNFKKKYQSLRHAAENVANFGFRIKNGSTVLDSSNHMEAQIALKFSGAQECYVVFVNSANDEDTVFVKVSSNKKYYEEKVEDKLNRFVNEYFLRSVALFNTHPCNTLFDSI